MENQPQISENPKQEIITPIIDTPETKTRKFSSIIMIIMSILMLGGVGFGIYGMFFQEKEECPKCEECEKCEEHTEINKIDNLDDFSRKLVKPYSYQVFGATGKNGDILEYGITDDTIAILAARNLSIATEMNEYTDESTGLTSKILRYEDVLEKAQELFGSNIEIEKKDYDVAKGTGKGCTHTLKYKEDGIELFYLAKGACGSNGPDRNFLEYKDAYIEQNNLIVEMYYGTVSWCGHTESDYCVDEKDQDFFNTLLHDHADKIPVYKMVFHNDNGRFVLSNIIKSEE